MRLIRRIKNAFRRTQTLPVSEFPQNVLLEPTNACNLRCRMCPIYGEGVERKREVGFINKGLWTRLVDEMGSWPSQVNLDLHGAGEPLLHPDLFEIVDYAKGKGNINVGFLCNGTLLDHEKARMVIQSGVDWVYFSVDGAEKEVFEYYRKGAVLDAVEDNIRYLLSLRKGGRPVISFNMVSHEEADQNRFIEKWSGLVDSLTISLKRPIPREKNRGLRLLRPCPLLYQQLVIGWPGKTGLCCEDFWGDYITGDLSRESLRDIWHGRHLTRARRLHEKGRQDALSLCRSCDTVVFHLYEEWTVEKNGRRTTVRKELTDINPELAICMP